MKDRTACWHAGVKKGAVAAAAAKASAGDDSSAPGTPASLRKEDAAHAPSSGGRGSPAMGAPGRGAVATPAGWGGHDGPTIILKDVVAALERDPLYAKSSLMYQLMESADFY